MIHKSSPCHSCGSTSAPDGARFCPDCGASFQKNIDGGVPMVAAVPMESDPSLSSSLRNHGPSSQELEHTPTNITTDHNMMDRATYWKSPDPTMLAQAKDSRFMGGILFVDTTPQGKFVAPKNIHVGHVLTGATIDLSRADLVHAETTISVATILGGLRVIVPRGVRVEMRGVGILGAFRGLRHPTIPIGQEAPRITIKGMAILSGVKVRVNKDVPPLQIVP